MGDSAKLDNPGPGSYRYVEHRDYLFKAWEQLGVDENVTLVIHDWGSALGFDWAFQHPDKLIGIAYMEAIVRPITWREWPEAARSIFQGFRSPAGDTMILENNVFIEKVLPRSILRDLTDEEMEVYRRPFLKAGEDRRPTLTWPRQIPVDGDPQDVHEIVKRYSEWLSECDVPKLFVNANPGAILVGEQRDFCRSWKNQTEVCVDGSHFLQEDSPREVGVAIDTWREVLLA
jgi:haloalkane dehalogenase